MTFTKFVFMGAGLYGLATLAPGYFLERLVGSMDPPSITHPEYFYGFLGVALSWQILFIVIAFDPARYRYVIPIACVEKLAFGGAIIFLYVTNRVQGTIFVFGLIDIMLGVLFVASFLITPKDPRVGLATP